MQSPSHSVTLKRSWSHTLLNARLADMIYVQAMGMSSIERTLALIAVHPPTKVVFTIAVHLLDCLILQQARHIEIVPHAGA
jgi:hypothetical protein